jgi:hypothetical protein
MQTEQRVKVRYLKERYREDGKPELNQFTSLPAVNCGQLVERDPFTGKAVTRLPGDVFELPEAEARRRCREYPLMFVTDDSWRARLERWGASDQKREKQRAEYAQMLQAREEETKAAQRLQASVAKHNVQIQDMAREHIAKDEAERAASQKAEEASAQLVDALKRMQEFQKQSEDRAREQAERDEAQLRRIADLEAQLKPQPGAETPPAAEAGGSEPSASDGSRRSRRGGGG